jgi:WhiB family redox-sensing transcriptional regulator
MNSDFAIEWRASGACADADPDIFFPIGGGDLGARQVRRALQVCASCQVRRQCLQFAMDVGEAHGIWGGTTPDERLRAHRNELARRRRAVCWRPRPAPRTGGPDGALAFSPPRPG